MGLPGALWMALSDPIAGLIWGKKFRDAFAAAGPSVWPAAIYATLLQPVIIAPAWWTVSYFGKGWSLPAKLGITAIPCALWGIAVGLAMDYFILQEYSK